MRNFGFKPYEIDDLTNAEFIEVVSGWNMEQTQKKSEAFKAKTRPRRW